MPTKSASLRVSVQSGFWVSPALTLPGAFFRSTVQVLSGRVS
jgi:hypothetical protein